MKTVSKKLLSVLLVAVLLVCALPMQALADEFVYHNVYFYDFNGNQIQIPNGVKNTVIHGGNIIPTYPDKPVPSSDTNRFNGKWKDQATGVEYTHGSMMIDVMQDLHLFPGYEADNYTCTFELERPLGYTGNLPVVPSNITVTDGLAFSANLNPAQKDALLLRIDDYQFDGWYLKGTNTKVLSKSVDAVLDINSNIAVVGKWLNQNCTVNFYHTVNGAVTFIDQKVVEYGKTLKSTDIPDISGFTNDVPLSVPAGWKLSNDSNAAFVNPTTVTITGNVNFYVGYRGGDYKVTLDANLEGMGSKYHWVRYNEKIDGAAITVAADPTWNDTALWVPQKTGYAFLGWRTGLDANAPIVNGNSVVTSAMLASGTWYGVWRQAATVQLKIYKDGVTTQPYAETPIYNVPYGEAVKISDYINSTHVAKAGNCTWDGKYYLQADWTNFCTNGSAQGSEYMTAYGDAQTPFEVKVMVYTKNTTTNNPTNSGSNNTGTTTRPGVTTRPADPTNPATGDVAMIEASVLVMTLAAAAVVTLMQLRKRNMI